MDPIEIFSSDLTFANLAAVAAIELPGRSCDNLSVTFDSCRGLGTQELLGDVPAATLLNPTQMWGPGRIAANGAELSPTLPFSLPSGQLRRDSEEISSAVKATAIKATSVKATAVKDATDLFTAIHACDVGTDVVVLRKVLERCRKRVYDVKIKRPDDPELSSLAAQRSRLRDLVRNKTTAEAIAQAPIASEAPGPAEVIAKKVVQEVAKAPAAAAVASPLRPTQMLGAFQSVAPQSNEKPLPPATLACRDLARRLDRCFAARPLSVMPKPGTLRRLALSTNSRRCTRRALFCRPLQALTNDTPGGSSMLDVTKLMGVSAPSASQMRVASVSPASACTPTPTSAKGSPPDGWWNATEKHTDVFEAELAKHEREERTPPNVISSSLQTVVAVSEGDNRVERGTVELWAAELSRRGLAPDGKQVGSPGPQLPRELQNLAQLHWNITSLRPEQAEVMSALLSRCDVLSVLPTGFGKSLTFQLPAVYNKQTAIVLSPLLALMQDQVEGLRRRGIKAAAFSGAAGRRENQRVLEQVLDGEVQVLYLSPERLCSDFLATRGLWDVCRFLHARGRLAYFVVDEAHCISEWGKEFRKQYNRIHILQEEYPNVPTVATTGTASPAVRMEIASALRLGVRRSLHQVLVSHQRPQVYLEIARAPHGAHSAAAAIARCVQLAMDRCSAASSKSVVVVYVRTRKRAMALASQLSACGVAAAGYHANLSISARQRVYAGWTEGPTVAIVATSAFGLGVDHASVRLVVHMDMPPSLPAYAQELGRAGRDGQAAHSIAFVNAAAARAMQQQIVLGDEMSVYTLLRFGCRWQALLHHFGEDCAPCGRCDRCCPSLRLMPHADFLQPAPPRDVRPRKERVASAHPCPACNYAMAKTIGKNGYYRKCTNCFKTRPASPNRDTLGPRPPPRLLCRNGKFSKTRRSALS